MARCGNDRSRSSPEPPRRIDQAELAITVRGRCFPEGKRPRPFRVPRLGGRCHLEGCHLPGTDACGLLRCSEGRGPGTDAGGDGGNLAVLFVVLGIVATADWLIFSELRWVHRHGCGGRLGGGILGRLRALIRGSARGCVPPRARAGSVGVVPGEAARRRGRADGRRSRRRAPGPRSAPRALSRPQRQGEVGWRTASSRASVRRWVTCW
jgi:hypothetical protein